MFANFELVVSDRVMSSAAQILSAIYFRSCLLNRGATVVT